MFQRIVFYSYVDRMYRVRFNLGAGDNYMKWKVYETNKKKSLYFDPSKVQIIMLNCRLVNYRAGAEKIFNGSSKFVVAWIECESLYLTNDETVNHRNRVSYNPKIKPNWVVDGKNADGNTYKELRTLGKSVFFE